MVISVAFVSMKDGKFDLLIDRKLVSTTCSHYDLINWTNETSEA